MLSSFYLVVRYAQPFQVFQAESRRALVSKERAN